jgi:RHS repeat-associated core domain
VIDPVRDVAIWKWDMKGEAFGNIPPDQDPDKDDTAFVFDIRLPGQRYDAATGFNQNYFRDYDPATGRYGQADPLGLRAGPSIFAYANADPTTSTDPDGLQVRVPSSHTWRQNAGSYSGKIWHSIYPAWGEHSTRLFSA